MYNRSRSICEKVSNMTKRAKDVTPEDIAAYRRALFARSQKAFPEIEKRRSQAWVLAHRAADILRERFGVKRVVLFGSLVHEGCFTLWSDVDLAVWGLRPEDTFKAMAFLRDLDENIEVNLVDIQSCNPSLRAVIESEGVEV